MTSWSRIDFNALFSLDLPVLELVLRASVLYLAVCLALRLIPKRHAGRLSPNDFVTLVIVGGVTTSSLARETQTVPGVLIVIGTVVSWSYALSWTAHRFPRLRPFLQEQHTQLVRQGQFLPKNLRRELVTEDDVWAQLRRQGVSDLAAVEAAHLEADGSISVVLRDEKPTG